MCLVTLMMMCTFKYTVLPNYFLSNIIIMDNYCMLMLALEVYWHIKGDITVKKNMNFLPTGGRLTG